MNRDEREQAIWRDAYMLAMSQDPHPIEASNWADAAVAEFRKRYPPPQTQTPPAVWYDEPPFEKDGIERACWIARGGQLYPAVVYWGGRNWRAYFPGDRNSDDLNGRRVCPIAKPTEPTP